MDPSRDETGRSDQEDLERLRQEELTRAQRIAQAQQASGSAAIPLLLPVMTPEPRRSSSERSGPSMEDRLQTLEDLIRQLTLARKQESVKESARDSPSISDSHVTPDFGRDSTGAVPQIHVRNRRFSEVLSTDTYRLRDRNVQLPTDQSVSLTQTSNQLRPRLDGYFFSGEPPLKVLSFLRHLTRVANQSRISAATLLWIVEDFMQAPARESFRAQAHASWPAAVHWLLITFAPESSLEQAMRMLNLATQGPSETVKQFGLRVQLEASTLGNLVSISEVKSLFSQGLSEPIRSMFVAHQPPHELADTTPLAVLVSRAELLETGTMQRVPTPRISGRTNIPLLVSPETSTEQEEISAEQARSTVLAIQSGAKAKDVVCFVCYLAGHWWLECPCLMHLSSEEKENIAVRRRTYYSNLAPRRNSSQADLTRGETMASMTRPGWKTDRGMVPPASIWPKTVLEKGHPLSSSENDQAAPKNT
jgi:hypothetical protein